MTALKETPIVAAAVRTADGVVHFLPRPHRHHHIVHALSAIGYRQHSDQGFLTSDGDYVDRASAKRMAINEGQLEVKPKRPTDYNGPELFSEDLW